MVGGQRTGGRRSQLTVGPELDHLAAAYREKWRNLAAGLQVYRGFKTIIAPMELRLAEKLASFLSISISFRKPISILDLGCGCGSITFSACQKFDNPVTRYLGIDLRREALDCNEWLNQTDLSANVVVSDSLAALNKDRFDLILLVNSIYGFSPKSITKLLRNHMKPSGRLVCIANSRDGDFWKIAGSTYASAESFLDWFIDIGCDVTHENFEFRFPPLSTDQFRVISQYLSGSRDIEPLDPPDGDFVHKEILFSVKPL